MTKWYSRHPDVRLTELEGEGVVLHLGSRTYFSINETGLFLFNALEGQRTLDELVGLLLAEYDVDHVEATTTASAFLQDCEEAGLVLLNEDQ
jgi:Coenzyme PQQ synthesis protein D (PqqD)